jgi:uncharacterized protein YdiU (UPF0061 family)
MEQLKLQTLFANEDLSLLNTLNPDPETNKYKPNKTSREVKSGHYVLVNPTPLPNPYLVIYSPDMAYTLGLDHATCESKDFLNLFSGAIKINSWATPYALSIYGEEMYTNCPFKNGNGYGDGRAISITEIVFNGQRWELQLKGSGKTPFCRNGDGRAVLRSCIREFLASEAMYHLGIPTTRALSITASNTEKVMREWYADSGEQIMQNSICAMLCRLSSSFIRIGHIELYGRRARISDTKELKMIVDHAIFREYPHLQHIKNDQKRYLNMLYEVSNNIAHLTAEWMRVGFTQGNFNSDNCHIGGKTIDYGPFGFIEKYSPTWNMWEGGGLHFSFMNQHIAGNKNFGSLVDAILPLLTDKNKMIALEMKAKQLEYAINSVNTMWAKKLGFDKFSKSVAGIKQELFELMEFYWVDFTILWRQLAVVLESLSLSCGKIEYSECIYYLQNCFYKNLTMLDRYKWIQWLSKWITLLKETDINLLQISKNMKLMSPKFVPREWMLKLAYEKANENDLSITNELHLLFLTPYDEHTDTISDKYYKKMKFDNSSCCMRGISSMSCSS